MTSSEPQLEKEQNDVIQNVQQAEQLKQQEQQQQQIGQRGSMWSVWHLMPSVLLRMLLKQ